MNWYAYVGGDPVNFVDPLGLREVCVRETTASTVDGDTITTQSRVRCYNLPDFTGGGGGDGGGGGGGGGTATPCESVLCRQPPVPDCGGRLQRACPPPCPPIPARCPVPPPVQPTPPSCQISDIDSRILAAETLAGAVSGLARSLRDGERLIVTGALIGTAVEPGAGTAAGGAMGARLAASNSGRRALQGAAGGAFLSIIRQCLARNR